MKINFPLFIVMLLSLQLNAQIIIDSTKAKPLQEVIINKTVLNPIGLPNQIKQITSEGFEFQNFQSTAEMLSNSGTLFVQKSQQGAGSPSIRGFEASRLLLLVDGIRMNNLVFRSGHLQNVITVDQNILDNVSVYYGPTSTLFGSDALGGTIAMNTKKAKFIDAVSKPFTGKISTRYTSVNEEKMMHFNLNYAAKKIASLTALTFNDFSDLKMGKRKNGSNAFFGELPFYVQTKNGVDQLVENNDRYLQKNSGYKQYNFLQKLAYKTVSGAQHGLNFQFSTSSDVPRYDRLTETTTSGLKYAEWYYGPQKRLLAVYSLENKKVIFDNDLKINLAYQNVKESRHNRRFGNYDIQNRVENINLFSFSSDLVKKYKNAELLYGIESYFEILNSSAFKKNINTGVESEIDSRYPNGKNYMSRNDFYLSFNEKINYKTFWNTGVRFGYTALKSTIEDNSFFTLPFDNISQKNLTYSGTLGVKHNPSNNFALKANISSGYRVPNIDDLAKVFESSDGILIVPNNNLKPEKTLTTDLGLTLQSNSKKTVFDFVFFYTRMFDAIITDTFTYKGQSFVIYNSSLSNVYANQNKGKAFVTGISTSFDTFLCNNLQLKSSFNYNLGRVVKNGKQLPLDHISPYFGRISIAYSYKIIDFDAYLLFNGKKKLEDYSTSGEDNLNYAPIGGTHSWETYNFKSSFIILKSSILFAGIENILDTQYRTFSSGINAPGRTFYVGLNYNF